MSKKTYLIISISERTIASQNQPPAPCNSPSTSKVGDIVLLRIIRRADEFATWAHEPCHANHAAPPFRVPWPQSIRNNFLPLSTLPSPIPLGLLRPHSPTSSTRLPASQCPTWPSAPNCLASSLPRVLALTQFYTQRRRPNKKKPGAG